MRCQRCGKETNVHILSVFNTQDVCLQCKEAEEEHPQYERARKAEDDAVRRGNYNFPGIGLPAGL